MYTAPPIEKLYDRQSWIFVPWEVEPQNSFTSEWERPAGKYDRGHQDRSPSSRAQSQNSNGGRRWNNWKRWCSRNEIGGSRGLRWYARRALKKEKKGQYLIKVQRPIIELRVVLSRAAHELRYEHNKGRRGGRGIPNTQEPASPSKGIKV